MRQEAFQRRDTRTLVKTRTPGIYKRGGRYVVPYRDEHGVQRKNFSPTFAAARAFKSSVTTDKARGEFFSPTKLTLAEYYADWLPSYTGRTRRGIREQTKQGYADQMRLHVLPTLGNRKLAEIGPRDLKKLAAELRDKGLSPNSVRLALAPLKALLASALEDELLRRNPAAGISLTQPRPESEADEARAKALTDEEARRLLAEVPERWRLFFEVMLATGLRIGEVLALRWRDLDLGRKRVLVRRRWYRGSFAPPKSRFGRRDVPITAAMAQRLWALRKDAGAADDALVFPSARGTVLDAANLYRRVFKPAARRAAVPWATFHTLRHTCATALFRVGKNPKQVQAWLGHHSAAFTMDTYVHLLPDDVGDAPVAFDHLGSGALVESDSVRPDIEDGSARHVL